MGEFISGEKKIYEEGFNSANNKITTIYNDFVVQREKYNKISENLLENWKGTASVKAKVKIDNIDKLFSNLIDKLNEINNDIATTVKSFNDLDHDIAESYTKES